MNRRRNFADFQLDLRHFIATTRRRPGEYQIKTKSVIKKSAKKVKKAPNSNSRVLCATNESWIKIAGAKGGEFYRHCISIFLLALLSFSPLLFAIFSQDKFIFDISQWIEDSRRVHRKVTYRAKRVLLLFCDGNVEFIKQREIDTDTRHIKRAKNRKGEWKRK